MKKLGILFIALIGFGYYGFGQTNAKTNVNVTVLAPLAMSAITPMNFGSVATSNTASTIELSAAATAVANASAGVKLVSGTPTSAKFSLTGAADQAITVSIPSAAVTLTGGTSTITVDTWVSSKNTGDVLSSGGTLDIYVGATLHLPALAAAGTYTATNAVDVTVNYQ